MLRNRSSIRKEIKEDQTELADFLKKFLWYLVLSGLTQDWSFSASATNLGAVTNTSYVIQVKAYGLGGEALQGFLRSMLLYLRREKSLPLPSPQIRLYFFSETSFRKSIFMLHCLQRYWMNRSLRISKYGVKENSTSAIVANAGLQKKIFLNCSPN